jgi:hypothetical protein
MALASQGVLVGLLTGIAGVGGGFAIVPALVLLAGLPMQPASGTSLLLIATNSLVALAALGHWPTAHLPILFPLVGGGFLGAVVGQRLGAAHRIRGLATPRPPACRFQGCRQPPERAVSVLVALSRLLFLSRFHRTMSERTFQFRLRSSHPAPDRATQDLVVEFLGDSGAWELQQLSLTMPGFRIYLISLLLCQHFYLVANAREKAIPLQLPVSLG